MPGYYLKCEYYNSEEGTPVIELRPDEYVITFRIIDRAEVIGLRAIINEKEWPERDEDWCIVNREDVVALDNRQGLIKLLYLKIDQEEKEALVAIKDLGDQRISYFTVPLDELVVK